MWALIALGLTGCPDPEAGPCAQDKLGCAGNLPFEATAECVSEAPLQVTLVLEGDPPEIHYGQQGGQHFFIGAHIVGAELDRYSQLEALFSVQLVKPRTGEVASRRIIFGALEPLKVAGDGVVEETGYTLVLDSVPAEPVTISVEVVDPCGRRGAASWTGRLD